MAEFTTGIRAGKSVTTFDELTDTPSSKVGQAGKSVVVNLAEDAVEYQEVGDEKQSFSTSLISGGIVSLNSSTSVDITAGTGTIVSVTGAGIATLMPISWSAKTNVAITDILTTEDTRFFIDNMGEVVQQISILDSNSIRINVTLGFAVHPTGTILTIVNDSLKTETLYSQFIDHLEALGVTRKSGLTVTADTGLSLSKSSGVLESPGAGVGSGNIGQNMIDINADPTATFTRLLASTATIESESVTTIDVGFYDDGSNTKAALPQPNDASIVYFYQSVDSSVSGLIVAYGQTVYTSLSEAKLNKDTDKMILPENIKNRTNLIGRMAVKANATDLNDITQAILFTGAKFGTSIFGGSSSSATGGGDVSGGSSSIINEIATYTDSTGKVLHATSGITADFGKISRITADSALWLNLNFTEEHITIGEHDDQTGVRNPSQTTAIITANAHNSLALITLGSNGQDIQFIAEGINRGAIIYNNGRGSVGISSGPNTTSNSIYIETLENNTSTMMVKKIGIGKTASSDNMIIDIADNLGGFGLSKHTTVQRDALTVIVGAEIWNTTTGFAETWDGSAWQQSVYKSDIVDNLTSTNTDKPLSANQGKTLQERTVEGGFFRSNAVQTLLPNTEQTIVWASTAFMGKQNPVSNLGSSTTLSLNTPGKYEITINIVLKDNNATVNNSVVSLKVDSNLTSVVVHVDTLRSNEPFTVGAITSHYSSFILDVENPDDSHILRCKLTLLANSGSYDVLTSTYFKAVKYD